MRFLAALLMMIAAVTTGLIADSHAATTRKDTLGFLYYSPGMLFTPIGSVRFGHNDWEGGYLGGGALGFDKIFRISNSTYYVAFGPAIMFGAGPGFYGAAGTDYRIAGWIAFRAELGAVGGFSGNQSNGFVLMGLALHI